MDWQHAGPNNKGQLGTGNNTDTLAPTLVKLKGVRWTQVAAGWSHTCGLASNGSAYSAYCWGE
jgi:alpha-tubulin suppressor-like RCC1 family protein